MKSLLIFILISLVSISNAQKKHWITLEGAKTKKKLARHYYIKSKIKGTKKYYIQRYTKGKSFPYEEQVYATKKLESQSGKFISFYTDGDTNTIGFYLNNRKQGEWKSWSKDKEFVEITSYNHGVTEGDYIQYKKGRLNAKGKYLLNQKEGEWNYYNSNGIITKTENYKNGVKNGKQTIFYDSGKPMEVQLVDYGITLESTLFDKDGKEIKELKNSDGTVYSIVEKAPVFPGGMEKLMQFLGRNTRYPQAALDNNIQGRAFISFIVEKDGSITEVESARSPGRDINEVLVTEAKRVVKSMPNWEPGKQRGKTVRVRYTVPINFKIR